MSPPPPQGHSSFITHLDWSKDGHFIMSNSGDYEILYCECKAGGVGGYNNGEGGGVFTVCPPHLISNPGDVAGGCKLLRNRFESRDREWASYTCVLGFHVFGAPCRGDVGVRGGEKVTLTPPPHSPCVCVCVCAPPRSVARRLRWHRHQLAVPLAPRAPGGRG